MTKGLTAAGMVGLSMIFAVSGVGAQNQRKLDRATTGCIVLPEVAKAYELQDEVVRITLIQEYARRKQGLCMLALPDDTRFAFMDRRPVLLFSARSGDTVNFVAHVMIGGTNEETYVSVNSVRTTTRHE